MASSCLVLRLGSVDFVEAWEYQKTLVAARQEGAKGDLLLLLEHPHIFTLGRMGSRENMLIDDDTMKSIGASFYHIDRGGDITYHGPGQLVGYPVLDLSTLGKDAHDYLRKLERVLIATLGDFGIKGYQEPGYTGVWVQDRKIGAIGVKISRWITMHGFALNVNPDLSYFSHIVPCGIKDRQVTSMEREVGHSIPMEEVMNRVVLRFGEEFGMRMVDPALSSFPTGTRSRFR